MHAEDLKTSIETMAATAKTAARKLALMSTRQKDRCLTGMADELLARENEILEANERDLEIGREKQMSRALLDRLELTPKRIGAMAKGLNDLLGLSDPVGDVTATWLRPNGLTIRRVRIPIGVIAIIYESRPNVTVDSAGLCLKAGNAVFLRGGSEAFHSNQKLAEILVDGGTKQGLPDGAVQLVPYTDRCAIDYMLKLSQFIDLVIPRGGEGLIRKVAENSTIPVIKHYKGVCHIYVDKDADIDMALRIVDNAKCQRPGVCNAVETVLIHKDVAADFAPALAARLGENGVELRGDDAFCELVPDAKSATEQDWYEEYLDLILSVRIVEDLQQALDHIAMYGSAHSDAIVTANKDAAQAFTQGVDSAAVYVNASTRFTDGGQFGMGAEIGISTDRIHARGPMGIEELTSYKYIVSGDGQVRD
ncbi:MAG: glutamate-5-semialdehyde dehydrogenase [Verrucomicrobiota bacterium]